MNTGLADKQTGWQLTDCETPLALEVVLHKSSYALPWNQFLYAQGNDDEMRIVFATHDVIVKGSGLCGLLTDVAAHRLAALVEPANADRFAVRAGRGVRELVVRKAGPEIDWRD
jgi:hypothetical protein